MKIMNKKINPINKKNPKITYTRGKKKYSAAEFMALHKENETDLGYPTNAVDLVRELR
jgi:hypothetical protein